MATTIKTTFQFKRGLAQSWINVNPILAAGEPGFELDTGKLKIGDGSTSWNDLAYLSDAKLTEEQVATAVEAYLEKNPIQIKTDITFSQSGVAADAAAIGEKCIYIGDTSEIIFKGGDADLID